MLPGITINFTSGLEFSSSINVASVTTCLPARRFPHLHVIAPGGGISLDRTRWVSCRPGFFLPVRVLSRLFRRLFLEALVAAHAAGRLRFFSHHAPLVDAKTFAAYLAPLRKTEWVVYTKRPFGGPQAVLAYLAR